MWERSVGNIDRMIRSCVLMMNVAVAPHGGVTLGAAWRF
jgi:hypothetical protein